MDKTFFYMQKAIELAENARGKCSPNPFVGAVIVKEDVIIGEGFTQPYGSDHAEVQAIKSCNTGCEGAEMYVTLEPCSHYGKTPPCAKAIIASGISKVYYGISDPNLLVAGKGKQMLIAAGIAVEQGFCSVEITKQLEYYLT
jgi:diaminohydroxyphosphoribosylaminopyrimidine deaminase/5-amino-6-(5-phosphoribosylamino)uracil reductase